MVRQGQTLLASTYRGLYVLPPFTAVYSANSAYNREAHIATEYPRDEKNRLQVADVINCSCTTAAVYLALHKTDL